MKNLTGSEKQIKWANDLRNGLIDYANKEHDKLMESAERAASKGKADRAERYTRKASAQISMLNWVLDRATSAAWWIDNREPYFGRNDMVDCPIRRWDMMVKFMDSDTPIEEALAVYTPDEFRGMN